MSDITKQQLADQNASRLSAGAIRAALGVTRAVRAGEMSINALEAVENRLEATIAALEGRRGRPADELTVWASPDRKRHLQSGESRRALCTQEIGTDWTKETPDLWQRKSRCAACAATWRYNIPLAKLSDYQQPGYGDPDA